LLIGSDYPFLDIFWTLIIFFAWVIWFWLLITILADVFRRHDIGGGKKTLWVLFVIFVPLLGVLIYLLVNSGGMADRSTKEAQTAQAQFDSYVKETAGSGGAAAEIEKAQKLKDSGAITEEEFQALKSKALAT
jgi:energy-coupling factor transporter transmembrane protein EcfT